MNLIFDTETTGKAQMRLPADHPSQPRIVQLGAILYDDTRRVVAEMNFLVKPDGWTIPQEATAIHGITTEMCEAYGLKITTVVKLFLALVRRSKLKVAHNRAFDDLLVQGELCRLGEAAAQDLADFLSHEGHCTMEAATPVLKLPGRFGDFKWPNLQEAHQFFMGRGFEGAHDAMADVRACAAVFFAMQDRDKQPKPPAEVGT
jgi:DNA polymerase III subunit epsilon